MKNYLKTTSYAILLLAAFFHVDLVMAGGSAGPDLQIVCPCDVKKIADEASVTIGVVNTGSDDMEVVIDLILHEDEIYSSGVYLGYEVEMGTVEAGTTLSPKKFIFENIAPSEGNYFVTIQMYQRRSEDEYVFFDEIRTSEKANVATDFSVAGLDLLLDSDSDGVGDYNERLEGTDPNNASSTPGKSTIDVLVVYDQSLMTEYSNEAGALARIEHIFTVSNQALSDSNVNMELRMVKAQLIDSAKNYEDMLNAGSQAEDEYATFPDLRKRYGADLITIATVRNDFPTDSCGVAGLGGAGREGFMSPSTYVNVNSVKFEGCDDMTVLHEIGHNMGLGHSFRQDETGTFNWSRGYGVVDSFYTVMAYDSAFTSDPAGDVYPTQVQVMSNPDITTCESQVCGVAINQAEPANAARSLDIVRFQVARYQATVDTSIPDTDDDGTPDETDTDDDNDGIPDTDEATYGTDPRVNDSGQDLDNDGLTNLEEHNQGSDPTNAFSPRYPSNVAESAQRDFNGDGVPDILIRRDTGSWYLYLLDGSSIIAAGSISATGNTDWEPQSFADFNGDGKADILIRHKTMGNWWLYLMDGTTIMSAGGVAITRDLAFSPVNFGDTDGDGNADVLMRHTDGRWWRYGLSGTTVVENGAVGATRDTNFVAQSYEDFNGDGNADILVRNTSNGIWWLYTLDGGTVVTSGSVAGSRDLNWEPRSFADFNGDSRADILLRNRDSNGWWLYTMDGNTIGSSGRLGASSTSTWHPVATEDFNGDGMADLLLRNESGSWWLYTLNSRTIQSQGSVRMITNNDWRPVSFEDFNQDSRSDVMIRNISSGYWWMYLLNGQTIESQSSVRATSGTDWQLQPSK